MAVFITDVAVRWSDMDVYGHVNNACVVTLLEEARTALLFGEGAQRGAQTLASGVVVVELRVRYRQPLVYSASPVRVQLWVSELRAASFALDYTVAGTDGNAVVARTQLAPYDTAAQRPRRLMPAEQEFLVAFQDGGGDG
ncbi:MAG TPA: thioesterase family protein [Pseudonocardiaceae bacterium]|nr:thioesterase family protein [Pseudonocardiaceae bacterium]